MLDGMILDLDGILVDTRRTWSPAQYVMVRDTVFDAEARVGAGICSPPCPRRLAGDGAPRALFESGRG